MISSYTKARHWASDDHLYLGLEGSVLTCPVEHLPRSIKVRCYMESYISSMLLSHELKLLGMVDAAIVNAFIQYSGVHGAGSTDFSISS